MASEQHVSQHTVPEILIAFVVESSLTVANEWTRVMVDYVAPMLRRITEAHPGAKPRLGFVTYATFDTRPSPILCKRFFVEFPQVTKEMKETPANLGIGATNSGGDRGMAALDGIVAALELFDFLLPGMLHSTRSLVSHIWHIASASPDASIHPQYNDTTVLDSVTWDDLPHELKKRNISFNSINVRLNLIRFKGLHNALTPTSKDSFLQVRPGHCVLLSGFPAPTQRANSTKRLSDVHTTPDPKRARLAPQTVDVSPKATTPKTPVNPPKPSPISGTQMRPQVPIQPPPGPTTTSSDPSTSKSTVPSPLVPSLLQKLKSNEEQIRSMQEALQASMSLGDTVSAQSIQQEILAKKTLVTKIRLTLTALSQQQATASASRALPTALPANPPESRPEGQQLTPQAGHNRTPSGSGPMTNVMQGRPPPQVVTNELVAQMQKMMDQRTRAMQPPQNAMGGFTNMNPNIKPAGPPPTSGPPSEMQNKSPIWQGLLSFGAKDSLGNPKENVVWVIAHSSSPAESCRVDTWPKTMPLQPSPLPAVPLAELQNWCAHHRPIICQFTPQTQNIPDPAANETNFRMLNMMLFARKAYAVASWARPSGEQGNNILLFPINANSLGGACFPLTGIPDLPRHSQATNASNVSAAAFEASIRARLAHLSPEQQDVLVNRFKQQRFLQLQHQMLPQGSRSANNSSTTNTLMNAMNMAQQSQQPQQQQPSLPPQQPPTEVFGGGYNAPSGNLGMMNTMGIGQQQAMMTTGVQRNMNPSMRQVPQNINYEMLQSFIQRSRESGAGGAGQ